MEKPASAANHERRMSIDNEPKTLLTQDLNLAREEALKVILNHTEEEAKKIFLTGLEPVWKAVDVKFVWDDDDDDYDGYDYDDDEF